LEILLKDIEELGYSGTGRKYGVSDNSIRKWIKLKYSTNGPNGIRILNAMKARK
jgi:transposase-like protein